MIFLSKALCSFLSEYYDSQLHIHNYSNIHFPNEPSPMKAETISAFLPLVTQHPAQDLAYSKYVVGN